MATRWSSEYKVIEIRDFEANKMAVDFTGSVALLTGRKDYGIVQIQKSPNILHPYPPWCKYEFNATEWNKTYYNKHICALAYSTQLQLLSCKNDNDLVPSSKLSAHTRIVLDINWHPSESSTLASASMDSFVHIWDIRSCSRPALSLSTVVGASRVRWNNLTTHLIATAHNGDLKIWDQRKAKSPIRYITAHLNNIYCLDWSYTNENQLITCSQDCTVKFFDINNPKTTENVLNTATPVWRAKYTPFGDGILIVLVPEILLPDNNLLLWNLSSINSPVHTFVGHTDSIVEFQWIKNDDDGDRFSDYELISWSKDQTLRLWHVESFLQDIPLELGDEVGIYHNTNFSETSNPSNEELNEIDNINVENELLDGNFSMSSQNDSCNSDGIEKKPVLNLHQEFLSLNVGPEVLIEQKDPDRRILIALVKISSNSLSVRMTFPLGYPVNVEPLFQITKCTYDASMKNKIQKTLHDSALKQVSKNLTCVQYCFHELVASLRKSRISFSESQLTEDDKKTYSVYSQSPSHHDRSSSYLSCQELNGNMLPRKVMGLKFCNNGALLWFNSPIQKMFLSFPIQKVDNSSSSPQQKLQPYWLSPKNSPTEDSNQSFIPFRQEQNLDKPVIAIYDVSCLFPINKDLAPKYDLDTSDVFTTCLKNACITNSFRRKDLVQTWTLAAYSCQVNNEKKMKKFPSSADQIGYWKTHPFTIKMIDSLIAHYAGLSDFQTAALLCCLFNSNPVCKTIHQDKIETPVSVCSNSPVEDFDYSKEQEEPAECFEVGDQGLVVVNDNECQKDIYYDEYKKIYMDVLDNLGLLDQQASIKKFLKHQTQKSKVVSFKFVVQCTLCKNPLKDRLYCVQCKLYCLKCSLCNSTVRGAAHVCLKCGHGGHANHLFEWFSCETTCAANCNCFCQFETMSILHVKQYDTKED